MTYDEAKTLRPGDPVVIMTPEGWAHGEVTETAEDMCRFFWFDIRKHSTIHLRDMECIDRDHA